MMRALSLTQPWASLVACGFKRIETRDWTTRHRGPLAIQAAKGFPEWAQDLCYREPFATVLMTNNLWPIDRLPLGVMLCLVTVKDVLQVDAQLPLARRELNQPPPTPDSLEYAFGDYSPGRWMWMLEDVQAFEKPIVQRGFPGLWEWDLPAPELLRTRPVQNRSTWA